MPGDRHLAMLDRDIWSPHPQLAAPLDVLVFAGAVGASGS